MGIIKEVTIQKNDVGASLNGEVLNRQTYKTQDLILKIPYLKLNTFVCKG